MGCSISTISLEHTPLWTDRHRYSDLDTEVITAVDGSEILQIHNRERHYPITLQSTKETGWIRGLTVTALRELSAVGGAYYTLTLNGTSYTVRFRNEQAGGAIQMETLYPHSKPGDDDWYIGTIYLMCVV